MNPPTRTSRADLLARVRGALGRSAETPVAPAPVAPERLTRLCGRGPELVSIFGARAAAAGLEAKTLERRSLDECLRGILRDAGVRRVSIGVTDADLRADAVRAAEAIGAAKVDAGGPSGLAGLFEADAGITDVDAGVAETGSLVVSSGAARSRGAWLVPPLHIALVPASRIIPDLVDLWPRRTPEAPDLPASLVLISGPSKTADIEGILVTGVHGPGTVHVLVITDL